MNNNKVYIETYGCQMNVYDTELVKSILLKHDYQFVESESDADVVMLNTCSVRDNANRKVYNRIHTIRQAKGPDNPVMVGILGCMATNFKTALLDDKGLKIDFIAGPDSYKELPRLISESKPKGVKPFDVTLSEFETYSDVYPTRESGVNAWIAIMRGCNNYCTFCVVPYTRGRERSRSVENVVDEVKRLVDNGFSQVTLLGQNVNSYCHEGDDFTELMARVSDVSGVKRIRFTSPHPKDFPTKLLQLMAERDNICKQIHLPLQAGSTRVLEKMNRTYSKEEFLALVAHIREIMPNVLLSTDIIVGFPTETADEFEETVEVTRQSQFDSAFIFKYSERPGTTAARRFPDDVMEDEKTRRIVRLNEIQDAISVAKNQARIGDIQEVLIEKIGTKKDPNQVASRNDGNQLVMLENMGGAVGDFVYVDITDATPHVLKGVIRA